MSSIAQTGRANNGQHQTDPIVAFITNGRGGIVGKAQAADLAALVQWLVSAGAEHRGRLGFIVEANGEACRVVLSRSGIQWGWEWIAAHVVPMFERAHRLNSLPRLRAPRRNTRPPAARAGRRGVVR